MEGTGDERPWTGPNGVAYVIRRRERSLDVENRRWDPAVPRPLTVTLDFYAGGKLVMTAKADDCAGWPLAEIPEELLLSVYSRIRGRPG